MTSFKEDLTRVLAIEDDKACAEAFEKFCQSYAGELPHPGEDTLFDKAMWAASSHMVLSPADEAIVSRVTERLMGKTADVVETAILKLKDLVGSGKEAAVATWQDMLSAMAWQQMVPAGAMRGVGTQMVSLGTIQKELANANIQLNLGWVVNEDQLRILLQAKDADQNALPDVELRINEAEQGTVWSRKTNEDGAMVAPSVSVKPGKYKIQIHFMDEVAETPFFVI